MERETLAGHYYTVTSKFGCTVTDSTGTLNQTVPAGGQLTVQAPSDKLIFSDDDAIVFKANFKGAPLVLGQPSGGNSDGGSELLPPGYIRLAYIEGSGREYINTGITSRAAAMYRIQFTDLASLQLLGYDSRDNKWGVTANGNYRVGTTEIPVPAGAVDTIIYDNTNFPSLSLSCNGSVHLTQSAYGWKDCEWRLLIARTDESAPKQYLCSARIFENTYTNAAGELLLKLIPVLTPSGEPCMYDTVSGRIFRNDGEGAFIAGLNGVSALSDLLLSLPYKTTAGATLSIGLPAGADIEEAQRMAELGGALKNWQITIV